ncbi:unnamed protein product [Cylindrotheca closterium]|uniref:Uncharacterized protein n=1 Tax=Cylindrotheca closterium TaxID=2856 RepID=A0AAD2G7N6_9STRA|nr:unnamed protein product [Cylindrotheca closterium]
MGDEDEEQSYNQGSTRSFFQDVDTSDIDSLRGSKATVEYIDDEDDIAASLYRQNISPSVFVEDNTDDSRGIPVLYNHPHD